MVVGLMKYSAGVAAHTQRFFELKRGFRSQHIRVSNGHQAGIAALLRQLGQQIPHGGGLRLTGIQHGNNGIRAFHQHAHRIRNLGIGAISRIHQLKAIQILQRNERRTGSIAILAAVTPANIVVLHGCACRQRILRHTGQER